jgi:hypothetical protein
MIPTFEQARAMYASDEQMARDLFTQLRIASDLVVLEQSLRRRAEAQLHDQYRLMRKPTEEKNA